MKQKQRPSLFVFLLVMTTQEITYIEEKKIWIEENVLFRYYIVKDMNFCISRNSELWDNLKTVHFSKFVQNWHAKRVCRAPWVSKSTHPRKFGNHVAIHCPPAARPSAPQCSQCSIPHYLASLGSQEVLILHTYCTPVL